MELRSGPPGVGLTGFRERRAAMVITLQLHSRAFGWNSRCPRARAAGRKSRCLSDFCTRYVRGRGT
jgi:hypothetical protein